MGFFEIKCPVVSADRLVAQKMLVWVAAIQSTATFGYPSQRMPRSGLLSDSPVCDCLGWEKQLWDSPCPRGNSHLA